jgi:multiple sugar transport system permease protein
VLGVLLALSSNNDRVKGRKIIRPLLIIPLVITPVVVGFLFRFMYNADTGIIPYLLELVGFNIQTILGDPSIALFSIGLAEIWYQTPFVFLILFAGLQAIPQEYYEAARVDGASTFQCFRYVTLPNLKFALLIATLLRTINSFNKSFDLIYVMTGGGPGNSTEVFNIFGFITAFNNLTMGKASALAILILVILIGFSLFMIRMLVKEQV